MRVRTSKKKKQKYKIGMQTSYGLNVIPISDNVQRVFMPSFFW